MNASQYTAVIRRDGKCWIGWVQELPGEIMKNGGSHRFLTTGARGRDASTLGSTGACAASAERALEIYKTYPTRSPSRFRRESTAVLVSAQEA